MRIILVQIQGWGCCVCGVTVQTPLSDTNTAFLSGQTVRVKGSMSNETLGVAAKHNSSVY